MTTIRITPFDVVHVMSPPKVGHVLLGLGDVKTSDTAAVMYAYTMPGDPENRQPTSDDTDGLDSVYGGSETRAGCGHSSIAGGRTRAADGWAAIALVLGVGAWMVSRRRAMVVIPLSAAVVTFLTGAEPAYSAAGSAVADATATVVAVSTSNTGGVFETTLDLAPAGCRTPTCPKVARAPRVGRDESAASHPTGRRIPRASSSATTSPVSFTSSALRVNTVQNTRGHTPGVSSNRTRHSLPEGRLVLAHLKSAGSAPVLKNT